MFSSLPGQDVPPSKEKAPEFMGLVGEAVELIPQDFIQLQRVDYLDSHSCYSMEKMWENMCYLCTVVGAFEW